MPSETGKQRKSRIALDYYRRPDAMTRARNGLALLAALGSIAWLAFPPSCHRAPDGSLRTLAIERLASPGPLASDHATWDSSCESCHTPFQAINHSAWSPALGHMPNSDTKCSACHTVGDHHANQFAVDIPACAECHRDHKGRDVSLISTDDAHCTACHGDIEKHRAGSGPFGLPSGNNVTRFARGEHPEFYWSRENHLEDPGQLRFNHALTSRPA